MLKAVINKGVASLMLHPHFESEIADEVLYGMVVEIENKVDDNWYFVKTNYEYKGYINKSDIIMDEALVNNWKNESKYVIMKSIADVMTEPKYTSFPMITLTRGAIVKETGVFEDKWEKIVLAEGREGWIRKGFAANINKYSIEDCEELVRNNLVSTALKYMDTQYRWGGKSPIGIDCSGLASVTYMLNGYIIPRDANLQQEYLKPIERKDTKPGDLVFFPGHVAVCIGNDKYVHATGREGYVLVNSFNPKHQDYREDLDKSCTGAGTIFGMRL